MLRLMEVDGLIIAANGFHAVPATFSYPNRKERSKMTKTKQELIRYTENRQCSGTKDQLHY
jgi:hypothetical protein